jgi:hypothetical protein
LLATPCLLRLDWLACIASPTEAVSWSSVGNFSATHARTVASVTISQSGMFHTAHLTILAMFGFASTSSS